MKKKFTVSLNQIKLYNKFVTSQIPIILPLCHQTKKKKDIIVKKNLAERKNQEEEGGGGGGGPC